MRRRVALFGIALAPIVAVALLLRRSMMIEKTPPIQMDGEGQVGPQPSPSPSPTPPPKEPPMPGE